MSLSVYTAFLFATLLVVLVPGPTNTLIVANSVRHGRRAALLNVAGTQVGLAVTVGIGASGPYFVDRRNGRVVRLGAACRRRLLNLAGLETFDGTERAGR